MFKWIILFIIFVATVKYFDIDVRGIIESPIVQDSLNLVLNILTVVWGYTKEIILYMVDTVRNLI